MFYNKLYFLFFGYFMLFIFIIYKVFSIVYGEKNKELENTLTFTQDATFLTMIYPKISSYE